MKSKLYLLLSVCCLSTLFAGCDNDDSYTIAPPTIVSVTPDKTSIQYGDTLRLTATLTDPVANLAQLTIGVRVADRLIATKLVPLSSQQEEGLVIAVPIPFTAGLSNGDLNLQLTLTNVLKASTSMDVTGVSATRPSFDKFYLVTDDGNVLTLNASTGDQYTAQGLQLLNNISYKIAQRLTAANQPDYTGLVLGDVSGHIGQIDEDGSSLFVAAPGKSFITQLTFDAQAFTMTADGIAINGDVLDPSVWESTELAGEDFLTLDISLFNGEKLAPIGELANPTLMYNADFFDRTAADRLTFLGATGDYTLYYNVQRQNVSLLPKTPAAYPDYMLVTGGGIGAPSPVEGDKSTCWWSFSNVRDYLIARKTGDDLYQLTLWVNAKADSWVSFKVYQSRTQDPPYGYSDFTWTGDNAFEGIDGGNIAPLSPTAGVYRLTLNMASMTVNVETLN
ncbi:MAG: hypothetical protein LBN24_05505 [Mediterranea sp.]|nr:hypothetical protein [Mediterranea sp.]